jgi:hypothetical protein
MKIDKNIPLPPPPGQETTRYVSALLSLQPDESIEIPRALYYRIMPNLYYHLKRLGLSYKYSQRQQKDYVTYRIWRVK